MAWFAEIAVSYLSRFAILHKYQSGFVTYGEIYGNFQANIRKAKHITHVCGCRWTAVYCSLGVTCVYALVFQITKSALCKLDMCCRVLRQRSPHFPNLCATSSTSLLAKRGLLFVFYSGNKNYNRLRLCVPVQVPYTNMPLRIHERFLPQAPSLEPSHCRL